MVVRKYARMYYESASYEYTFDFDLNYLEMYLDITAKYYELGFITKFTRKSMTCIDFSINKKYLGNKIHDEFIDDVNTITMMEKV